MFTGIKTKISNLLKLYRSLPSIFLLFYISLVFIVILMFSLTRQLSNQDCVLLICDYKNIVIPIMNAFALITFWPSLFILIFNINSIYIIISLLFLTMIYWQILSYIITWGYCKLKKNTIIS